MIRKNYSTLQNAVPDISKEQELVSQKCETKVAELSEKFGTEWEYYPGISYEQSSISLSNDDDIIIQYFPQVDGYCLPNALLCISEDEALRFVKKHLTLRNFK